MSGLISRQAQRRQRVPPAPPLIDQCDGDGNWPPRWRRERIRYKQQVQTPIPDNFICLIKSTIFRVVSPQLMIEAAADDQLLVGAATLD